MKGTKFKFKEPPC